MSVQLCPLVQLPTVARVVRCPGSCIAGHWDLPDMGAGKRIQVLCKNSKCFQPQRHLSRPPSVFLFTSHNIAYR